MTSARSAVVSLLCLPWTVVAHVVPLLLGDVLDSPVAARLLAEDDAPELERAA